MSAKDNDRADTTTKVDCRVRAGATLDLAPFVLDGAGADWRYKLYALVEHRSVQRRCAESLCRLGPGTGRAPRCCLVICQLLTRRATSPRHGVAAP